MSVSILFSCRDDFHFDEGAEVNWGLRCLEGHGDFGLAGGNRLTVPSREDGCQQLSVVSDKQRR